MRPDAADWMPPEPDLASGAPDQPFTAAEDASAGALARGGAASWASWPLNGLATVLNWQHRIIRLFEEPLVSQHGTTAVATNVVNS